MFLSNGRALVEPINHPSERVSNQKIALTSLILVKYPGSFETKNTRYVYGL